MNPHRCTALLAPLALGACVGHAPRDALDVPVDVHASAPQSGAVPTWSAAATTSAPSGLVSAEASYALSYADLHPGPTSGADQPGWSGSLLTQRSEQALSARLPSLLATTPLQLEWAWMQQRSVGPEGMFASRSERALASWSPGPLRVAVDPFRPRESAMEVGAARTLDLDGWMLLGQVAWQPAAGFADPWSSRASITRTFWRTPLTASWERSQPQLWSLGTAGSAPGQQAGLGVDLAPALRGLIGPRVGASVAYSFLKPDDPALEADQRVVMGFNYGW